MVIFRVVLILNTMVFFFVWEAEARGLQKALCWILRLGYSRVLFELEDMLEN